MVKRLMLFLCGVVLMCSGVLYAQNDLEDMYLRKAVKEFVGKNYDNAIVYLEQVLTANPASAKAKKLMAKCFVLKGDIAVSQSQGETAKGFYEKALAYDAANAVAAAGIQQIKSSMARTQTALPPVSANGNAPQQAYAPSGGAPASPIVISTNSGMDTNQTKIISGLLNNFEKQQEIMRKQMEASGQLSVRSDDTKDKYLNALVNAAEQKNTMMKQFIVTGAIAVVGIVLLIVFVFLFMFHRYSKTSDLRTLQATDTIAALLAAPSFQGNNSPLLIGSSSTVSGTGSMDALNTLDPTQRAQAVEAVAAEIIEPEKNSRMDKIKKLEELLKDENNRVRANAAKALYEIDKQASINTLTEMMSSQSKRMRSSAVWALGEIASEEATELILGISTEDDEIVNYNIKVALEKIKTLKRFTPSQHQQKQIDEMLAQLVDMA